VYGEYGSFCPSTNEIRLCTDSEQVFLHEMSHTIDEHLENYKIIDYGFGELETAKEMKIKLTDEEVSEVLEIVLDSHDAMFGINWDNIECAIDELESLQQLKRGF